MEANNPLVPAGYDIVWSLVAIVVVALVVAALVSLSRTAPRLSPGIALAWAALVLVVPVLGSVAWLAVGRRAAPDTGSSR